MQLTTLRSSIEVVKHQAAHFGFHHLGYSDEEIQMASGPVPWLGIQRSAVKGIIQEFSMGALSLQGLSPMAIPAEYMAAVIISVVHPTNWMLACRWVERTEPAQTMGQSGETVIHESVTAERLFSLMLQIAADEVTAAKAQFTKQTARTFIKEETANAK